GALMGVYPGFTADQFGVRNNSVNYGIMFIGFAVAGYFGPSTCGRILGSTGSYGTAFIVSAVLAVVGIVLSFLYRRAASRR
ncbi:MAG: MFS transporter, partial [Mogibacterium sp.]|nr:MFS transporter [Mogibacterium sp.]